MSSAALKISPSAMMDLIKRIEDALWERFEVKKYVQVKRYLSRWQEELYDDRGISYGENFQIVTQEQSNNIDLPATLDTMTDEQLFQVAVDLGVEVPGLIYSVAEIKGVLSQKYEDIGSTFVKAHENIYSDPATAIIMANSALERIIKKICLDESLDSCKKGDTLYKLTTHILKQFNFFPDTNLNTHIKNIGSGVLTTSKAIEDIRSNHTEAHGTEDEIISDPLYAMLVVNSVATVGLFLLNYYEKHYQPPTFEDNFDEIPF